MLDGAETQTIREITIIDDRMASLQLLKLRPLANIFWDGALEVIVTYPTA